MGELILGSSADIDSIEYHDRYLFTPLSAALLTDLIVGLRDTAGINRWNMPTILVTTTKDNASKYMSGRYVWDNWPDLTFRDSAIHSAFEYNGMKGTVKSVDKLKSIHGRVLTITFSTGQILTVRLDQGISYWRAVSSRYDRPCFDFTERQPTVQGEAIANLVVDIEASPYPTHVFTKVRSAE